MSGFQLELCSIGISVQHSLQKGLQTTFAMLNIDKYFLYYYDLVFIGSHSGLRCDESLLRSQTKVI